MTTPHSIQELCGRTIHSIQGDFETSTVTFYDRNRVPLFSVDIRELWAPDGNRWIERINNAVNFTADKDNDVVEVPASPFPPPNTTFAILWLIATIIGVAAYWIHKG